MGGLSSDPLLFFLQTINKGISMGAIDPEPVTKVEEETKTEDKVAPSKDEATEQKDAEVEGESSKSEEA